MRLIALVGAIVVAVASTAAITSEALIQDVTSITNSEMVFCDAEIKNGTAFNKLSRNSLANMASSIRSRDVGGCTFDNAAIRTEFRYMTNHTRRHFTNAIRCLQSLPPQHMTVNESGQYPGVKSRYDEYVATHINYTYNIHMTADFFAWHRFFIHQLEQDLQDYCGYNGTLPYWDWQIDSDAPQDSPIFNGDHYSMGSNGAYVANRSSTYLGPQEVNLPPGTGGGCLTSGPFSNYTVDLGPVDSPLGGNVDTLFQYNPRCLVRDFNPWISQQYNTYTNVTYLLTNFDTIEGFQAEAQGYGSAADRFGIHGGGHWLGGTPSTLEDFHSSPGDPIFFLHHAMVDRVYVMWQYQDISNRQNAIDGTSTLDNDPPSAEMTLDDMLPFGFVADDQRFGDLMDIFSGPFCYRYE